MTAPTSFLLTLAASAAFSVAAVAAAPTATPSTLQHATLPPPATPASAEFDRMDGNNDGTVSTSEHEALVKTMFAAMDADGDGNVTAAEMDGAHKKMAGHDMAMNALNSAQKIRAFDTNKDGILSQGEHAAGAAALFQQMDGDSNGSVTRQELDAGRAEMIQSAAAGG